MIHLAVIISRFPCTFEHQFGVGYPAVLRHRMHNNEPLAFPCWFLHPRPIFLPVPDKIIAMVFIHIGLIQIHFRTNDIVTLTIPPFFTEVPVASPTPKAFAVRSALEPSCSRKSPLVRSK